MKKAIIFALVAFLLSIGGTTAFLVMTHKPVPAAADSLAAEPTPAADSLTPVTSQQDSAAPDTVQRVTKPDSTAGRRDTSHTAPPALPAASPVAGAAPGAAPGVTPGAAPATQAAVRRAVPADPAAKAAAFKQVARTLSAMKPVEAAKLLGFLSDEEVEGLLRAVGPRQAADFLTNLPKERAARLSRRLLVPKEQSR